MGRLVPPQQISQSNPQPLELPRWACCQTCLSSCLYALSRCSSFISRYCRSGSSSETPVRPNIASLHSQLLQGRFSFIAKHKMI
ncbi:unnamed protein product [Staurois parvus]|uniref:Uncharacterized protein n=1 Tax=Staurois parvus TaxID=386267 RepID=A0ABN9AD24_9NEOB|nr:unnamed protein product [Staurois parvus]